MFHFISRRVTSITFRLFLTFLDFTTQAKMIMNKRAKFSIPVVPTIIEPDYDEGSPRRKQRFKEMCSSIHHSKYYPISCPPSLVSGLQHPANLIQSSIPHTVIIVKKQRQKVKDCIDTAESSVNGTKRKRASTTTPENNTVPFFCAPPRIPSSPSSILPLGKPLAAAPSLPRLVVAARRAIPKFYVH